jgi:hypothetical protein
LLKDTGIAHNHLWFYRDVMEACLAARDWSRALHHAEALERTFRGETLPWVVLMVERARAIAAAAQKDNDEAAMTRLRELRATAVAAGNGWALEGIDQALM